MFREFKEIYGEVKLKRGINFLNSKTFTGTVL